MVAISRMRSVMLMLVQVVQHDEGQRARADDDDQNDVVHAAHHVVEAVEGIGVDRDAADRVKVHQPRQQHVLVRYPVGLEVDRAVIRRFAVLALPAVRREVEVVVDVIFAQAHNPQRQLVAVLVAQGNGVAQLIAVAAGKLRVDHRLALLREGDALPSSVCRSQ